MTAGLTGKLVCRLVHAAVMFSFVEKHRLSNPHGQCDAQLRPEHVWATSAHRRATDRGRNVTTRLLLGTISEKWGYDSLSS